jgi:GntR family transcriptional regulator, transcriptional repressor for pyruvate dehydrogenase complex
MTGTLQGMPDEFLLRPLEAPPAYAAVVDRIRRAMALGVLLPGDRLPAERALAEELGVSRVTVREALRLLQGEGLLVTKRGSGGTIVSPTLAGWEAGGQNDKRMAEVFELRLAVETMAARLAAERVTDHDVGLLEACQESLESSSDVHAFRRADSEFHLAVARFSGNRMLRDVVEDVRAAVFSRLDRHDFAVIYESSIRGHAHVIEAIKNRDPAAASAAMGAHIEEARAEVMAVLSG